MSGTTPEEAFRNFVDHFQTVLHCITESKLGRSRVQLDQLQILAFQHSEPVPLRRPQGQHRLFLDVTLRYRLHRIDQSFSRLERFRAALDGYIYTFLDNRRQEIVSFHWDPRVEAKRTYPHLHVGSTVVDNDHPFFEDRFSALHIPTGHLAIESIVRFAIEELEVLPLVPHWEAVLNQAGSTQL